MAAVVMGVCSLFLYLVYECWTAPAETSRKTETPQVSSHTLPQKERETAKKESSPEKGAPFILLFFALLLFLSLRRFFLPTIYILDDEGVSVITAGWVKKRKWNEFRNAYFHKVGIHLSPFEKPHFLDSFRGVFLRYNRKEKNLQQEEVERFVREKIGQGDGKS
ncbi:MAG: hypothetical protein N2234_01735 [Planctomycetota bacterium]|nr:hypothetical protein [Planctomycetota bacterium]